MQHTPPKKIAILGFGAEGKSALKFLKRSPLYKKAKFFILDKKTDKNYLKRLTDFDLIIKSPGIPFSFPEIQKALKKGVRFSSITELFFEYAPGLIIGVTGTKGKGTTTTLIYKILKAAKKDVHIAGNIGKPAAEILGKLKKNSISVLELSSFQLQNLRHSPHIAAVLDIFPDHMDAHKNFREYVDAKANIARWQKAKDKLFFIDGNPDTRWIANLSRGKKHAINIHPLVKGLTLKMPGSHNLKNASIAAAVAKSLGVSDKTIKKVIKNFTGLEHRLELSRSLRGVDYYNDSGSTNPETAAAAVRAFKEAKVLIAGGYDKNLDYKPLMQALKNSNTRLVVLFGGNKKKIGKAITAANVKSAFAQDLQAALHVAQKTGERIAASGKDRVAVLFSPGSASFDMFKNYKDRGKIFKKMVRGLK